jgi:ribosomal protein S18 acetylase RimI-like enzyme
VPLEKAYHIKTLRLEDINSHENDILAVAADQPDEYWTKEHFLKNLPLKWELSFVVWRSDKIVAYAILSQKAQNTVHIHHFMVKSEHRGEGLGSEMLAEVELRSRRLGAKYLTLKVRHDNNQAKGFYQDKGFELQESQPHYQPMKKTLESYKVAIHQPNYMPWLGYFHKIAKADIFIFLDNVQFSKSSFTNRVKILSPQGPRWLTVPVSIHLGDNIHSVRSSNPAWARSHSDTLLNMYRQTTCFKAVWPQIRRIYETVPSEKLCEANMYLIKELCVLLDFSPDFKRAFNYPTDTTSDDRLIELVSLVAPGGTYLSGAGAAKYQDPQKFAAAGLGFEYLDFRHPEYTQEREVFEPGLSVLDAVFHLGFEETTALLTG